MDSQKQSQVGKRLKDMLASRRLHKRPLSGGSKKLLRDAVLQLIDHHQQFDLLIKESSSLQNLPLRVPSSREESTTSKPAVNSGDELSDKHGQFSVDLCISYLQTQSRSTGVLLGTLAATMCVAKLSEILQQSKDAKSLFLTPDAKNAVSSILDVVARLKETHSFDRVQFVKELTSKGPLPLELLWQLHIKSIMTFDLFITSNLGQPQVFTAFTGDVWFCAVMCVEEGNNTCNDIMKDITQFFIVHGYGARIEAQDASPSVAAVQKACVVLLDTVVGKILDSPEEKGPLALAKLLAQARINPSVPSECLVKFFAHVLVLVLSHRADITVKDAIATQEQWSFGKAPSGITSMYRELLLAMECKDAMGNIQRVLEREELNWKSLLTFSATLLVCFQEAPQMIKDMIDTHLNQSLESCEQDSLIAAFLLARQAANEGPHVFQSYPQWFREQFGEGASHLGNKKAVAFFLAFLTSLVPHEPAEYLKAHVKNQPHVPSKCRESLADYNSLAKTRLADLKVPLDSEGIFSSTSGESPGQKQSGKTQMQDQAVEDVDKSIAAYERTAKIPNNVMEASIFRRPYYIGRFLPALLTPRLLPDVPDSKMKFIEELKCADKIPGGMLQNYEDVCAKEASSLLEGAFTDDAFDDCLEPMDSLNVSLEKLPSAVLSSLQSNNESSNGIAQHVSVISDRLGTVLDSIKLQLGEQSQGLDADCIILDLDKSTPNLHAQHMQVVDMILDGFCKTCLAVRSLNTHPDRPAGSSSASWDRNSALWASQMVAMVSKHRSVIGALYHRLWNLTLEQGNSLSTPHINGIAVFLVNLQVHQQLFPPVFISGATDQQSDIYGTLLHHITRHLSHHDAQWMQFTLQFTTEVIDYTQRYVKSIPDLHLEGSASSKSMIPVDAMKKFCYLLQRLCPDVRQSIPSSGSSHRRQAGEADKWARALALYQNEEFQTMRGQYEQLTFKEWLALELQVEPHNDELDDIERQDYYRWIVHSHFLTIPIQNGGCGGSYTQACTIILETLLDNDVKSVSLRNGQLCCHGNREVGKTRRQNGCRSEIIQLLQELVPLLSSDSSPPRSSQWLLSIILNRINQGKPNDRDSEIQIVCFMRLACCLPAYLLFANDSREVPAEQFIKSTCDLINSQLRSHDQGGAYGLSMITTSYILRALLHFCQANSIAVDQSSALIDDVFGACPIVPISFLIHCSKLWPVVSSAFNSQHAPEPLSNLNSIHQWAKSFTNQLAKSGPDSLKEMRMDVARTHEEEPWLLSVAMVMVIMGEDARGCDESMLRVVDIITIHKDHLPSKVVVCALEYILAQISWDITWNKSTWNAQNVSNVWRLKDILSAFEENTVLKKSVLARNVSRMFPVVYFRLLLSSSTSELQHVFTQSQFIHTLLKTYASLVELHCQAGLDASAQSREDNNRNNSYSMPLSLEFHLSCTRFLHNYIAKCPLRLLQNLDRSVLMLCDDDITTLIRQRLGSM